MGVFSSFLSVVQENVAISAELLGRAGEAGEIEGSLPCKKLVCPRVTGPNSRMGSTGPGKTRQTGLGPQELHTSARPRTIA